MLSVSISFSVRFDGFLSNCPGTALLRDSFLCLEGTILQKYVYQYR